jgi:ABC-2 type transport system ATP-binding protein
VQLLALTVAHPARSWTAVTIGRGDGGTVARSLLGPVDAGRARAVLAELGLGDVGGEGRSDATTDVVTAALDPTAPAPDEIVAALVGGGVRVRGFEVERASLEQRFVELTGEGFDVVQ